MKKLFLLFLFIPFCYSCDVAQQVMGTYALTQCKYDYNSISNLQLVGVNLQNVKSLSSLNVLSAANLVAAFSSPSGSLPLNFTLNLNVQNPNTQTAILNGLSYILEIDGQEMTTGVLNDRLQIAPNQAAILPISMAFDLRTVMSGKSLNAIKNLAFNFAGIGDASSNVTVKLQPSLNIGGQTLKSPTYIPVSFTLNK
jgi:Late embryogenesis abundant protein.